MRNHKDLIVWQKSMKLVKDLYQITQVFPKEEIYGITSAAMDGVRVAEAIASCYAPFSETGK